jgi:hypothetical protein
MFPARGANSAAAAGKLRSAGTGDIRPQSSAAGSQASADLGCTFRPFIFLPVKAVHMTIGQQEQPRRRVHIDAMRYLSAVAEKLTAHGIPARSSFDGTVLAVLNASSRHVPGRGQARAIAVAAAAPVTGGVHWCHGHTVTLRSACELTPV